MAVRKDEVQISINFITDESKDFAKTIVETEKFQKSIKNSQKRIKDLEKAMKDGNVTAKQRADILEEIGENEKIIAKNLDLVLKSGKRVEGLDLTKLAPSQLIKRARQLGQLMRFIPQSAPEFKKLEAELKQVNDQLATTRAQTRGVSAGLKDATKQAGLWQRAMDFLKDPLAIFGGFTVLAGAAANEVKRITDETNELRRSVSQLTQLTGKELDEVTVRIRAIGRTFNQEEGEVLRATNTLVKEFGISYETALGQVENGLLSGADASKEFLDNVREYATQFEAAGFSAEDFINISIRAQQEGIYSDKGLDVVKEFGLRIREQTTAVSTAMEDAFGKKFTDRIFKGINDGSITSQQALKEVAGQMRDTQIPANKLQAVIADVFAAPGEDAGIKFIQSLADTEEGFRNASREADIYRQAQEELLTANEDLAFAENELSKSLFGLTNGFNTVWTNIKTVGITVLNDLIHFIEEIPATLNGISAAIKTAFKADGISVGEAYREGYLEGLEPIKIRREAAEATRQAEAEQDKIEKAARSKREKARDVSNKRAIAGMAAFKAEVANLQKQLENTEGADTYVRLLQQIADVTVKMQAKQREFNNAVVTAAGGSISPDALPIQEIESAGTELLQVLDELGINAETSALSRQQSTNAQILAFQKRAAKDLVNLNLEKNEKIAENEERSIRLRKALQEQALNVSKDALDVGIQLLSKDEEARKKNAAKIKAFQIGKVTIDGVKEVQGIFASFSSLGPIGQILAAIQAAVAVARTGAAIQKIKAQKFAGGGYTGPGIGPADSSGHKPAGVVHGGEWVAPAWMVQRHGGVISQLEGIRQRGFAKGGFVPDTTPTPTPTVGEAAGGGDAIAAVAGLEKKFERYAENVERWQRQFKVSVSYLDVEEAGTKLADVRGDASL